MPQSTGDNAKSLPWQKKLAFAVLATVGFFLLLETCLVLIGIEPATRSADPFVGFSHQVPLLEADRDSSGQAVFKTAANKLSWFNPQSFPVEKPANTVRVVCVGGSTTFGRPFDDRTSFCGWLREYLPLVDSSKEWEVINAGGVSYASYRVAVVMEEFAGCEPDLFIVYTGHNEFLENRTYGSILDQSSLRRSADAMVRKTRTWAGVNALIDTFSSNDSSNSPGLASEVDERLNHSIGPQDYHRDPAWQKNVLSHFESNLARMSEIAKRSGAEILFITPASNIRDCSPFKSETSIDPDSDQAAEFSDQLQVAKLLIGDGEFESALELLSGLVEVDGRHAEAHFLRGQTLIALERYDEAGAAFRRAIDEDVCPLRATSAFVETVRRVARDEDAMLVDFEERLLSDCERKLGHRCVGEEYFLDHVHPTIDANRTLALWLIDELRQRDWIRGATPSETELNDVRLRVISGIDRRSHGVAFRNLAKVLHWSGKFAEAIPRARDALELIPEDPESRFLLADCLVNLGRDDEAFAQYTALMEGHEYPRAFLPFGELLAARGDLAAAKAYLMQALMTEREDHRVRAHFAVGLVHLRLGEYEFAAESMEEVLRRHPNDEVALAAYAEAKRAISSGVGDESASYGEGTEK